MPNPKISIIIPTYNHGQELCKCLDSVFAQTFRDFEIIIINDGSTDGTEKILDDYLKTPPLPPSRGELGATPPLRQAQGRLLPPSSVEIKIINQKNQGAPVARNNGFKESKGEYVIFLDADIVLRKDALEKMLGALGKNTPLTPLTRGELGNSPLPAHSFKGGIAYAYSDFKFGFKKFKLFPFDGKKLRKNNYIHTSALIRRDAFPAGGFDVSLKKFQDWDLWLTMLEEGHIGVWIPEVLFKVKQRKQGMSEWLPSFIYKIPWAKFGIKIKAIEKYEKWLEVVRNKHGLG
ncbi:MAG: glycosyltransferase family 2 protein [bacterium]